MEQRIFKAALFDLDGVVLDTEPQYTVFWGSICRQYHPKHPGLEHASLHAHGVKTAVVTSSNIPKMESVYRHQPTFQSLFDAILTSEDFDRSKPDPDCYLKAAQRLGAQNDECIVFEDSFNGLRAGKAAGMVVVGMATTNSAEAIAPFSDYQATDYEHLAYDSLQSLLCSTCKTTQPLKP